jgi:formylglycine-generating enzyme required for sulfatase activity
VAAGTYDRTYTNDGSGPTAEADPATVSSFRLERYAVTVGRFRQFVAAWAAGWRPSPGSGRHAHLNGGRGLVNVGPTGGYESGWQATDTASVALTDDNLACDPKYASWTTVAATRENLPINCVNWWEARAFCIWDGGFLPSETEWEYAAAGGDQQREYPWGTTDPGASNQYAIYTCDFPTGNPAMCSNDVSNIAPVGTAALGAGRWTQVDLVGNVWQWMLDSNATYVPCTDCAYLDGNSPVVRGGSFNLDVATLVPALRDTYSPDVRDYIIGFRCARVAP